MGSPDRLVLLVDVAGYARTAWIGGRLGVGLRRRGLRVAARMPVQTVDKRRRLSDADLLAVGSREHPREVCADHRSVEHPGPAYLGGRLLGAPTWTLGCLLDDVAWPDDVDVAILHCPGGIAAPLAVDGTALDLAARIWPTEIVLVAPATLRTAAEVGLAAGGLRGAGTPVVVYLDDYDDRDCLHHATQDWLRREHHLRVCTSVDDLVDALGPY